MVNISLQLLVPVKYLQQIFSEHKNDHSTGLRLMPVKWLEMGEVSWKSLSKALSSQIVEESTLTSQETATEVLQHNWTTM